jgi:two-component system sensor histidine kinase/response regulator
MKTKQVPSTILYAEDDELVRQIAVETLLGAGYRVVAVADGVEALEALKQVQPDLILSDVRMPRCDGFKFLQKVRRDPVNLATPFIIMSAKADTADQRMGMSLGADDYVTKPYKPEDLLKTIEVRLARAALINDTLQQQQRFLTRVLPHELRTPLTGIIGYADLMVNVGESGETLTAAELVDYGRNLGRSGNRLLRVAEDFSLWAWLESRSFALRAGREQEQNPALLTAAMMRQWSRESAEHYGRDHDFLVEMEETTLFVPGEGLERVVSHLIDNAFKFSLPGTQVYVTGHGDGANYSITVSDRGRGINDDDLANIGVMRQFGRERFEQQGIGMGLVLARSFAQLGGGQFQIARNPDGTGMFARLTLPRPAVAAAAPKA